MKDLFFLGIVTGGYAHKVPALKGTFGTLGALAIYCLIWVLAGRPDDMTIVLAGLAIIYTITSFLLEPWAQRYFNQSDPRAFIIDEWAGYFVSMLFLPAGFYYAIIGFCAFRVFDIVKPFPIKRLEKIRGGIVWDDLLAGVYANLLIQLMKCLI
ncbi:MAG: phosphatidylglycerophosphatase A [Candidatus Brocadiia bacterium]